MCCQTWWQNLWEARKEKAMSKKKPKIYVKFFASRIKHGLMTLEEVPEKYKEPVQEFMKTDEYYLM